MNIRWLIPIGLLAIIVVSGCTVPNTTFYTVKQVATNLDYYEGKQVTITGKYGYWFSMMGGWQSYGLQDDEDYKVYIMDDCHQATNRDFVQSHTYTMTGVIRDGKLDCQT